MKESSHRWLFDGVALGFAALVLLLVPWTTEPVAVSAEVIGVYGVAVCVADLATAVLLIRQYRREGSRALLVLLAAYLLGACLVLPMALAFPGAFGAGQSFGHDTTAAILFLAWRFLSTLLLFAAVLLGTRHTVVQPGLRRLLAVLGTIALTLLIAGLLIAFAVETRLAPMTAGRFTLASFVIGSLVGALSLAGAVIAFATRAQSGSLFGWVALVLLATAGEMLLSTLSGGRFTVGWYVSRCITVVSSYLLLAYLAAEFARELRDRPAVGRKYAYVAAVALGICAVLLRYFLDPWLGSSARYATLFGAVAIAVWMGGWRPAVVTALVGYALAQVFLSKTTVFGSVSDILGLALFAISGAVIIALGQNLRSARESHQRAEERFRKSQEAAIQGYGLLRAQRDASGQIHDFLIEYVNPRGAALARQKPELVTGRALTEVLPGVRRNHVFETLRDVADTGRPLEVELRYEQEGRSGWFRNLIVKVDDGVAVSFFDVTHARRLEQELAQRANLLERADINKSRFLATLSHELRNPLAPLRNGLAILKRRSGGEGAEVLGMMERQLTQMVRLVDDLLDVSRIDRGKIDLRRERVPVDAVVSSAIETARPSIDAKSHELLVRFAQKAFFVEGDPVRLAQIVANLLINAAKFTPAKGRIELSLKDVDGALEISVRDNGMGIEPEQLPRVFEMFVQLGGEKDRGGGLGLGLALVKSLVEMHHGTVEARSAGRDQGAEFIVRLPLAAMPATTVAAPVRERAALRGQRILVVDDNEDAARTLGALLVSQGHEVSVFFNAQDALESASHALPDIAFLDLNMPGVDGYELAASLRGLVGGGAIRLIAVTGMGRLSDVTRTREAGFESHLTKPADPELVLRLAGEAGNEPPRVLPFTAAPRNG